MEEHSYDVFAQLRSDIINGKTVVSYDYNRVGQLVKETHQPVDNWRFDVAVHGVVSEGQRAVTRTYAYDDRGNLASVTTGTGVVTSYTHDELGNLTSSTDALNHTTYTTWDKSGHKTSTKDALGMTVVNTYDTLGRLKSTTGADGSITVFDYDNAGLLVRSTQAGKGQVIDYAFDDACQVTTIHEVVTGMGAPANTERLTSYSYDAVGNRTLEVLQQNSQTFQRNTLGYDAEHRLVSVSAADLGNGTQEIRIEYDGFGNRSRFNSWSSNADPARNEDGYFFFDALNRLVRADATDAAGAIDALTTDYAYDADGNLGSKTQGGAVTQVYTYDAMNRLSSSLIKGHLYNTRYDSAGRVVDEWTAAVEIPDAPPLPDEPTAPGEPAAPKDPGANASQEARDEYQKQVVLYNQAYAVWQQSMSEFPDKHGLWSSLVITSHRIKAAKSMTGYERRSTSYDAAGRTLVTEIYMDNGSVKTRQSNDSIDAAGNVLRSIAYSSVGDAISQFYTSTYVAGATGAVLQSTSGYMRGESGNLEGRTGATAKSTMVYDANGHMVAVSYGEPDWGDSPTSGAQSKFFVFDAQGNILKAVEVDKNSPTQEQYEVIANGELQMRYSSHYGDFGDDVNDNTRSSFWRAFNMEANQNPLIDTPVTSNGTPGNGGNVVVVNDGDTLQTIAQRVYGNAALWYMLADVNQLDPNATLQGGQVLAVPARVDGVSQVQAYNNGKLVGSTMPNLPSPPPPKKKWYDDPFSLIISIVVFVVVAYCTRSYALAAAAAGLTQQHVQNILDGNFNWKRFGKLTLNPFSGNLRDFGRMFYDPLGQGDHEHMNYKAVVISAIAADVGQAAGFAAGLASSAAVTAEVGTVAATAMTEAALIAGATVTTALTSKHFSWKAVAASYLSQEAGNFAEGAFREAFSGIDMGLNTLGRFGQLAVSSAVQNVAYQVIRDGHVNWREVSASAAYSTARGLISDNVVAVLARSGGGQSGMSDAQQEGLRRGFGPLTDEAARDRLSVLPQAGTTATSGALSAGFGRASYDPDPLRGVDFGLDTDFGNAIGSSLISKMSSPGNSALPALASDDKSGGMISVSSSEDRSWSRSFSYANKGVQYSGQDGPPTSGTEPGPLVRTSTGHSYDESSISPDTDAARIAGYDSRFGEGTPVTVTDKVTGAQVACWRSPNGLCTVQPMASTAPESMQVVVVSGKAERQALLAADALEKSAVPSPAQPSGTLPINAAQLSQIMPQADANRWTPTINASMGKYGIDTRPKQAAFLAQVAIESGQLKAKVENLNYSSAARLTAIWPKRFPTDASALPYVKNPEKLANKVYANRMGNGNEISGDGYKYRGRGLLQTTGRNGYREAGAEITPDALTTDVGAADAAGVFWKARKLPGRTANVLSRNEFDRITKIVNGGTHGAQERWDAYQRALAALEEK